MVPFIRAFLPALALSVATAAVHPVFAQSGDPATGGEPATAQNPPARSDAQLSPEELKRRLDLLAAEVEQLRSGETDTTQKLTPAERQMLGLGPSASSVYERKSGVSFAGYGEMLLQRLDTENESGRRLSPDARIDLLRAIVYTGYRFNDRFVFNSEIEFEHGGEEVGVEFAYLDYKINSNLSLRGGMLLVPLGLVNEFHEPNVFIGSRRPETERRILPSTWHENGAGVVGLAGLVTFRAYAINGLNAASGSRLPASATAVREERRRSPTTGRSPAAPTLRPSRVCSPASASTRAIRARDSSTARTSAPRSWSSMARRKSAA